MTASPAPDDHYDVVIAGGGMVGASLALLLSENSREPLRILLVEAFPPPPSRAASPQYTPSYDARSTALSYGSRQVLESIQLWASLQVRAEPITSIHVSRRGALPTTLMDSTEVGWPALGYVVENAWLGATFMDALTRRSDVQLAAPATVTDIHAVQGRQALRIEQQHRTVSITASLVVIADGGQSKLRRKLGIDTVEKDYRQSSLIANVSFSRPHCGRAYERFAKLGPLALLPLGDGAGGEPRAALVWSLPTDAVQDHLAMCDADFLRALQQSFGHRLGEFTRVGERVCYPLKLIAAQEQVRSGIVVMGNAAHSLHPVAGQGFNLALRDCARLTSELCRARSAGAALGDLQVLQRYLAQQKNDQQRTVIFSDQLPTLFGAARWPLSLMRDLGLGLLDMAPALKHSFIEHTAGMYDGAARGGL